MIINTQWKYRKNILFVWTNSKRISDTLLELIKIYQILVFHILSSRNRRRSRIKRISYIYIYIEESRSNSSDFCQASLKREARESRPPFISGGARGRGTKQERGEKRDTGPECLFSNEDGTGRFGSRSIRWTQHWKILDTWVLILRPRSAQRNSRYSLFNPPLPFSLKRDRNGMLYIIKSLYIRSYDLLSLSFPLISNKFEFRILEEIYYIYMEE